MHGTTVLSDKEDFYRVREDFRSADRFFWMVKPGHLDKHIVLLSAPKRLDLTNEWTIGTTG